MNRFVAEVSDARGRVRRLVRESASAEGLAKTLGDEGWLVVRIDADGSRASPAGRLTATEVIQITKTLAQFLDNGLPLAQAVALAQGLAKTPHQQSFWTELSAAIHRGESLHQALAPWKGSFSPLYLGLVQIGEQAGTLSGILGRLSSYLDARKALADKTANALIYPCLVLAVAVVGIAGLLVFVLPPLTEVVRSIQPRASQGYRSNLDQVVGSLGLAAGGLGLLVTAVAAGLVARAKNGLWRLRVDRWLWTTPGIRGFVQTSFGLHVCFALETLLVAGYPVEVAVGEAAQVVGNRWAGQALLGAQKKLQTGVGLVEAFRTSGSFPETMLLWIALGEASHDLAQSFRQLRVYYQQTWETQQSRLMSLVEPGLILLVGVIMVFLVLTFVTPVFSLLGGLL